MERVVDWRLIPDIEIWIDRDRRGKVVHWQPGYHYTAVQQAIEHNLRVHEWLKSGDERAYRKVAEAPTPKPALKRAVIDPQVQAREREDWYELHRNDIDDIRRWRLRNGY